MYEDPVEAARDAAAALVDALGLEAPPVALAFVEGPPAGIPEFAGAVPSACAFWREAERGTFYASAAQHANCPIGAHVMGFPSDATQAADLQAVVEKMVANGYIEGDEPARIPTVQKAGTGIVYGPLASFPVRADLVVLWLSPVQAMLLQEAAGQARWSDDRQSGLFGRPGCAALPIALGEAAATLSAGCTGMRTFTELSGDRLLAVLPGDQLGDLVPGLERARAVDGIMQDYYDERRAALGGGTAS